jgi:phosphoglycolate phosphatase-like HAD superfamily hydrolase
MFGDRVEDMQAATAAGIQSVGIAQSAHSKDQLLIAGASLAYSNFEEAYDEFETVFELFTSTHHDL